MGDVRAARALRDDLLRPSLLTDGEARLQNKEGTFPGIGSFMVEPGLLSLMNVLSAPPFL